MNIIEKAVEKLESELDELLRDEEFAQGEARPAARRPKAVDAGQPDDAEPKAEPAAYQSVAAAPAEPVAPAPDPPPRQSDRVDLDLGTLSAAGFATPLNEQSLMAEEFRIVKRPILERASQGTSGERHSGNLIIVTSALPGEGKTFNAINLAFSIAMEVDRTVLLVDADVAKSGASRILGLAGRKGLSDYLHGNERDLSKLIVRTNVESLSVLPSGPGHGRITELLASAEMRRLVQDLSSRYPDRVVLFDSSPLLATSGSAVLAGLMGQVLLVVEAVRTPQSAVREALRRLGPVPNVGAVFNKQRRLGLGSYGYGYGGYYGYGYGDSERHDEQGATARSG